MTKTPTTQPQCVRHKTETPSWLLISLNHCSIHHREPCDKDVLSIVLSPAFRCSASSSHLQLLHFLNEKPVSTGCQPKTMTHNTSDKSNVDVGGATLSTYLATVFALFQHMYSVTPRKELSTVLPKTKKFHPMKCPMFAVHLPLHWSLSRSKGTEDSPVIRTRFKKKLMRPCRSQIYSIFQIKSRAHRQAKRTKNSLLACDQCAFVKVFVFFTHLLTVHVAAAVRKNFH